MLDGLPMIILGGTAHPPDAHGQPIVNDDMETLNSKIALSEARTDTKFAQLTGRIDLLLATVGDIDRRQSDRSASVEHRMAELRTTVLTDNRHTRSTVRNTGFALAGLIIASLGTVIAGVSLYPSVFGFGLQVRDIVRQEVASAAVERSKSGLPAGSGTVSP